MNFIECPLCDGKGRLPTFDAAREPKTQSITCTECGGAKRIPKVDGITYENVDFVVVDEQGKIRPVRYDDGHTSDCGTQYRGCAPECTFEKDLET